MGEETGVGGEGGGATGLPGAEKEGHTHPAWMAAFLGPSTGGKEPPAGAFHPPGLRGALGRGGAYQS